MARHLKNAGWGIIAASIIIGAIGVAGLAVVAGVWFVAQAGEYSGDVGALAAWAIVVLLCGAVMGVAFEWGNG